MNELGYIIFLGHLKETYQQRLNWYYLADKLLREQSEDELADGTGLYAEFSLIPSKARAVGYSGIATSDGIDNVDAFWKDMGSDLYEVLMGCIDDAIQSTRMSLYDRNIKETFGLDKLAICLRNQMMSIVGISPFQENRDYRPFDFQQSILTGAKANSKLLEDIFIRPAVALMIILGRLYPIFPEMLAEVPSNETDRSDRD